MLPDNHPHHLNNISIWFVSLRWDSFTLILGSFSSYSNVGMNILEPGYVHPIEVSSDPEKNP